MSSVASPAGELIDVDGRRLHVLRRGAGNPAVVFESGAGIPAVGWRKVQNGVAEFAATLAWDRPGYAWSDPPAQTLSLDTVSATLGRVLAATGTEPPYVLVGHSLAGFYVRHFAASHPNLVAGLVLVDPSHERQLEGVSAGVRLAQAAMFRAMSLASGPLSRLARRGTVKPLRQLYPELTESETRALAAALVTGGSVRVAGAEVRRVFEEAAGLGVAPGALGDLPLVVLGAGKLPGGESFRKHRLDVQLPELAGLSTRGRVRMVPDSGHGIPTDAPDAVVEAIREVWLQAGGG